MSLVITCGSLIDGTGRAPVQDAAILVEDNRVQWAGPRADLQAPAGAENLDLESLTVVPGLIDCHEHLGIDVGDEEAQCMEPVEYIAAKSTKTARDILRAGITTIRDVGEKALVGPMLKRAIEEWLIPGPRMIIAGRNIVRTGGHGWFLGVEADGPYALRAAVRNEVRNGADLIKIMVSGGVSTKGSDVFAPEFTEEEVQAVIDEAHKRGRKVAAHGHGGPGIQAAVRAGVDSIEHGAFLTADDVQAMVEHGTYLVVTQGVMDLILEGEDVPAFQKAKLASAREGFLKMLAGTKGTGLKIAVGTDENHGKLYHEMQVLVSVGYDPMDALLAGTRNAADLCGRLDDLGTLEAGKLADFIAVEGDPLADFSRLGNVQVVMKDGRVVHDERTGNPRL